MKKLSMYIKTPFGINGATKLIEEARKVMVREYLTGEEVDFSTTTMTNGVIDINGSIVKISLHPVSMVTVRTESLNGIVASVMSIKGAIDALNAKRNSINSWDYSFDNTFDDEEPYICEFDEFFDNARRDGYVGSPSIADIDIQAIVDNTF